MNDKVIVYRGRLGDPGIDGVNGAGVLDIRKSIIDNPSLDCLYNNNLSRVGDLTFTRSGEATIIDRYGDYQFITSEDFTNEFPFSEDFSMWDDVFSRFTISATGQPDPLGGNDATHITLDATTTPGDEVLSEVLSGLVSASFYTISFWIKVVSGTFTAVETGVGIVISPIDWTPTTSFQRVSISVAVPASGIISSINPIGTSGSVFALFGAQFEKNSNLNPYLKTTGVRVTASNPADGNRHNQNGYLLESTKTNLITFSEDLGQTDWGVSGVTLSRLTGENPFGNTLQRILLTFAASNTGIVTKTVTLTNAVTYQVTLFVKLISGNITQFNAAIGGGTAIDFDAPTSDWVRLNVTVVAGANNDLVLTIISPEQNAVVAITGVMVETGSVSSYIRTAASALSRPFDLLTTPYQIGRPDEAWTIIFAPFSVGSGTARHVLDNGLSGSDSFAIFYTNTALFIVIGSITISFAITTTALEIILAYDGANIDLYEDGIFIEQKANAGSVVAIGTTLNIGGDGTSANSLDAQLGRLRVYDTNLTALEIAHVSGEF